MQHLQVQQSGYASDVKISKYTCGFVPCLIGVSLILLEPDYPLRNISLAVRKTVHPHYSFPTASWVDIARVVKVVPRTSIFTALVCL